MVDAALSKILCWKGSTSSCKGWRVAWPWRAVEGRGWVCREHFGTISHSVPAWQLLTGLHIAGHQATGWGRRLCVQLVAADREAVGCPAVPCSCSGIRLVLGLSWDGPAAGVRLGQVTSGGPFLWLGQRGASCSEQRVTAPPEGDPAHPRVLRIDQDHPLELPATFHCCAGSLGD